MKALGEKNGDSAVFTKDGWSGQETAEGISGGKVNLNAATLEQLMTLRGIGEARARDIIAYREKHGDFQRIEDIKEGVRDQGCRFSEDKRRYYGLREDEVAYHDKGAGCR